MSVIVLDDCEFYLSEAERYLSLYEEIDSFQEIFEAYTADTKLKVEQNEKAKTGVKSSLSKAIDFIINTIKNIKNSITSFFSKLTMSKDDRRAYEEFKARCAKDPSLKNKKVTVQDYKKLMADYDALIKEAEEADRKLAQGNDFDITQITNKFKNYTESIGKGALYSVGVDAALGMASSSRDMAKGILYQLEKDEKFVKELESAIGKHNTKKFKKDINSLTKRISLTHLKMRLTKRVCSNVQEAWDKTYNNVWDLINLKPNLTNIEIGKNLLGNKDVRQTVGKTAVAGAKTWYGVHKTINQEKRLDKKRKREEEYKLTHLRGQSAKESLFNSRGYDSDVSGFKHYDKK